MNFGMITSNQNMEKKTKFCYTDTDSFAVYIKIKGIYVDIGKDVETRFDNSNYELDRALPREQKTNWLMRDELGRKIMRTKTYSYLTDNNAENRKSKGNKKCDKTYT